MKTSNKMTPFQIASSVIEKLKEQNRVSMDALQKSQSDMRRLERELDETKKLVKIMESRVRAGSNTYLEMGNRQKEITIKHLELQIQKLLKENADLEGQINNFSSDYCAKCETKILLGVAGDNKPSSKPVRKGTSKNVPAKKMSDEDLQKREKTLERIVEHKDKRIFSLTKEIQRLNQVEKELSNKIYRLNKLLEIAHMPTDAVTECLLKEIHSLESQLPNYQEKQDKLNKDIDQLKDASKSYSGLGAFKSKLSVQRSDVNEQTDTTSSKNLSKKINAISNVTNVGFSEETIDNQNANGVSKLHLLYNDVVELKHLFASENEKLFMNLTKESLKNDVMKSQWVGIIDKLNEIADSIENIIKTNSNSSCNKLNSSSDETIITRLQDRLKDAIELTTQYENEIGELKSTIKELETQIQKEQISHQFTQTDVRRLSNESTGKSAPQNSVHVQHLKELLNEKQKQLDSTQSHLKTYQNFVEQMQGVSKESQQSSGVGNKNKSSNTNQADIERCENRSVASQTLTSMERKLTVAERNIKTLEDIVENLQKVVKSLKEENFKLTSEVNVSKQNKATSENNINVDLRNKLQQSEENLTKVQSSYRYLEDKVSNLEEKNSSLEQSLQDSNKQLESLHASESQRTILQTKLDKAEKKIRTLESNIAKTQNGIEELKDENAQLKTSVQISESRKSVDAEAKEDEVLALKNEGILKDIEIRSMRESLHAIEVKALEMSHYRKKLRQEIEKLCDALLEKSDPNKSFESRKVIYKAAVLQSAKALLQLDEDYNEQAKTTDNEGAFEEMNQQVSVYLTEVARIHELLTIKNKQREDLLKEFLETNDQSSFLGLAVAGFSNSGVRPLPSSSQELSGRSGTSTSGSDSSKSRKGARSHASSSSESDVDSSHKNRQNAKETGSSGKNQQNAGSSGRNQQVAGSSGKNQQGAGSSGKNQQGPGSSDENQEDGGSSGKNQQDAGSASKNQQHAGSQTEVGPKDAGAESITSYLLSRCAHLENILEKQNKEQSASQKQSEMLKHSFVNLKSQFNSKNNLAKRLNTLIEMMRSKGCSDEIAMEQLKSEIKWLVDEHQKTFEKIALTQTELSKCKEENLRAQNDLDNMRRMLVNEKYEHAKVNSELKLMREQLLNSVSSSLNGGE